MVDTVLVPDSSQNTFSSFIGGQLWWKWLERPNSEATHCFMGFINSSSLPKSQALSFLKCYRTLLALSLNYMWLFINLGFKKTLMKKTLNVVFQKTVHSSKDHFSGFLETCKLIVSDIEAHVLFCVYYWLSVHIIQWCSSHNSIWNLY